MNGGLGARQHLENFPIFPIRAGGTEGPLFLKARRGQHHSSLKPCVFHAPSACAQLWLGGESFGFGWLVMTSGQGGKQGVAQGTSQSAKAFQNCARKFAGRRKGGRKNAKNERWCKVKQTSKKRDNKKRNLASSYPVPPSTSRALLLGERSRPISCFG